MISAENLRRKFLICLSEPGSARFAETNIGEKMWFEQVTPETSMGLK
jgi:hypothetical protein